MAITNGEVISLLHRCILGIVMKVKHQQKRASSTLEEKADGRLGMWATRRAIMNTVFQPSAEWKAWYAKRKKVKFAEAKVQAESAKEGKCGSQKTAGGSGKEAGGRRKRPKKESDKTGAKTK